MKRSARISRGLVCCLFLAAPAAAQTPNHREQALGAAKKIADDEDRNIVLADLETIPGQVRFW